MIPLLLYQLYNTYTTIPMCRSIAIEITLLYGKCLLHHLLIIYASSWLYCYREYTTVWQVSITSSTNPICIIIVVLLQRLHYCMASLLHHLLIYIYHHGCIAIEITLLYGKSRYEVITYQKISINRCHKIYLYIYIMPLVISKYH